MVIHCCQLSIVAMTSHLATVDTNFKKKSYSFVLVLVQMIAKDQSYKMTKHENHDGDDSHITIHLFLSSEILAIEIFLRPILPPRRSRLPPAKCDHIDHHYDVEKTAFEPPPPEEKATLPFCLQTMNVVQTKQNSSLCQNLVS